ncbi:MAG: hypothetical protein IAE79_02335 [Anaerolinea sp.]|nr:hypothetical protein [Anaerolinea sp.]
MAQSQYKYGEGGADEDLDARADVAGDTVVDGGETAVAFTAMIQQNQ